MKSVFPKESKKMFTGNYLKLSKLEEGEETRIRILTEAAYGWEDWTEENKPIRYRDDEQPAFSINAEKPMKEFMAFCIWNYETEAIQIMHLTQKRVIKALKALEEKKGVLTSFDIRIIKNGEGKHSVYTLLGSNVSDIPDEATDALERRPVNLEALFDSKDPFAYAGDLDFETGHLKQKAI